ncbi:MAG: DUF4162 domain-containing protein, partial [Candidatus Bathyarchaeia archaeon]
GISVIHLLVKDHRSLKRKLEKLSRIERIVYPDQKDQPLKVYTKDVDAVLSQIIDVVTSCGSRIMELRIKEPSLDDVFIQMINSKEVFHYE